MTVMYDYMKNILTQDHCSVKSRARYMKMMYSLKPLGIKIDLLQVMKVIRKKHCIDGETE
jgi:hypothetical protein